MFRKTAMACGGLAAMEEHEALAFRDAVQHALGVLAEFSQGDGVQSATPFMA